MLSEKIAYLSLYYLAVANIFAFANFAFDKHKAINQQYRIPERRLFITACLGGGIGALIAMKFLRHKTLKSKFRYGIPAITILTYSCIIVLQNVLSDEILPYMSSLFDKAEGGGLLFILLYPFIEGRGEIGLSVYWSSVWTIIAIILYLSITYVLLLKKISPWYRILLYFINAYVFIWMGFECVIGVLNSDSLLKAIILLSLPFTLGFTIDFAKGFARGVSSEL
ncbi:DUF1294 domain-containing protein [Chengkuizengella axinellae]|uniref:DUF1294 domain-containing protein n=1 Tax=Chengkuizengella axinellae TaxID=3064388 RepID=A0ABT9IY03_9BACL|nr:DUF1294 domain-containing protein [Chengkuizengella sp. 2205SS18-9]MDP5274205.1 DUF1294 domain-containing protein [Chengkuizengella sp. 2205SS18-9]